MHSLPIFVKLEGRRVILLGAGEAADTKRRILERAGALACGEEMEAALAIVAIEDETEARVAVMRLRARGVLVNAVDRPALCDFTLPAIVDRDPVLIAVGTGGASAGLAKALRQRLEALLPQSLCALAEALGGARAKMRERWPDAATRRRAIDAVLAEGSALDPLSGAGEDAVKRWLESGGAQTACSRLEEIAVSSDDPDDLTLRAARLLGQADVVFHAPGIAPAILDRARADAIRRPCGERPDWNETGLALWLVRQGAA